MDSKMIDIEEEIEWGLQARASCRGNNPAVYKAVVIFYFPPNEINFPENVLWDKWAGDDNGPFFYSADFFFLMVN